MITKGREEPTTELESFEFYKKIDVCVTNFENYQILPNKISHRYLVTTELFTW
jgi:hypothetical protein